LSFSARRSSTTSAGMNVGTNGSSCGITYWPLSGGGGARATPDLQASIPPPRSAPAAGYALSTARSEGAHTL
jgi:hypothetical protein